MHGRPTNWIIFVKSLPDPIELILEKRNTHKTDNIKNCQCTYQKIFNYYNYCSMNFRDFSIAPIINRQIWTYRKLLHYIVYLVSYHIENNIRKQCMFTSMGLEQPIHYQISVIYYRFNMINNFAFRYDRIIIIRLITLVFYYHSYQDKFSAIYRKQFLYQTWYHLH